MLIIRIEDRPSWRKSREPIMKPISVKHRDYMRL